MSEHLTFRKQGGKAWEKNKRNDYCSGSYDIVDEYCSI